MSVYTALNLNDISDNNFSTWQIMLI